MQASEKNRVTTLNHRKVRSSTTLNRKYTKRPTAKSNAEVKIKRSPKVQRFNRTEEQIQLIQPSKKQGQMLKAQTQKTQAQAQKAQVQKKAQTQKKVQKIQIKDAHAQAEQKQAKQIDLREQMIQIEQQKQMLRMKQAEQVMQKQQIKQAKQMKQAELKKQEQQMEEAIAPATLHPVQNTVNMRMRERTEAMQQPTASKFTAKQLKDQAIQKALASAEKVSMEGEKNMSDKTKSKKKTKKFGEQIHFSFGRIALATACAAAAVFAIVYFVNLNMPDISLRVAAMQTGIDPAYPNYVPRDFSVSSITSSEGKIVMNFVNNDSGDSFTLTEEKSSWDTNALLSNFVKDEYGENYSIVREQGLTIYISGSNAAWVNGGIVYKIDTTSGNLSNKQIRSIAVSL